MSGIGVLVNPLAGGNAQAERRVAQLRAVAGNGNLVLWPASLQELGAAVLELRDRQVEVVAVCGGDGSFFRALSALVACYGAQPLPGFLPLRAGSMNTVARGLHLKRQEPEVALQSAAAALAAGRLARFPHLLMRVNQRHIGFMSGAGTIVAFLQAYNEGSGGPLGASKLMARLVGSAIASGPLVRRVLRWVDGQATLDGETLPYAQYSVIYASTIADIGLGFRPTYRAGTSNEKFHFLAGPVRVRELVAALPRIFRGRSMRVPQLCDRLARRVEIEFSEPQSFMVDGDVLAPVRRLVIEAGPTIQIAGRG